MAVKREKFKKHFSCDPYYLHDCLGDNAGLLCSVSRFTLRRGAGAVGESSGERAWEVS